MAESYHADILEPLIREALPYLPSPFYLSSVAFIGIDGSEIGIISQLSNQEFPEYRAFNAELPRDMSFDLVIGGTCDTSRNDVFIWLSRHIEEGDHQWFNLTKNARFPNVLINRIYPHPIIPGPLLPQLNELDQIFLGLKNGERNHSQIDTFVDESKRVLKAMHSQGLTKVTHTLGRLLWEGKADEAIQLFIPSLLKSVIGVLSITGVLIKKGVYDTTEQRNFMIHKRFAENLPESFFLRFCLLLNPYSMTAPLIIHSGISLFPNLTATEASNCVKYASTIKAIELRSYNEITASCYEILHEKLSCNDLKPKDRNRMLLAYSHMDYATMKKDEEQKTESEWEIDEETANEVCGHLVSLIPETLIAVPSQFFDRSQLAMTIIGGKVCISDVQLSIGQFEYRQDRIVRLFWIITHELAHLKQLVYVFDNDISKRTPDIYGSEAGHYVHSKIYEIDSMKITPFTLLECEKSDEITQKILTFQSLAEDVDRMTKEGRRFEIEMGWNCKGEIGRVQYEEPGSDTEEEES